MVQQMGGRKMVLGILYLLITGGICGGAVYNGTAGWDAAGVGSLCVSIATGLGVVVWGNVKEHQAKNGG